ncbi:MAG: sulfite exporter TauE/SafE family protein [Rudaea sp.]|uniref:sulfite exporter TauE/SafE family protein n=1 Tax=Rudaea sp. TaxID=2136325 RepID=UPI0039E6FA0D
MPDLHSNNAIYTLCGLLVGVLVGFTGVGGGSLMTPLLVLVFGFNPATAVGTDLLYAALTKTCGTLVHGRNATVDWRLVGRLASGSIPAALAMILLLRYLDHSGRGSDHLIGGMLGMALILTAAGLLFRGYFLGRLAHRVASLSERQIHRLTVALGLALGILVSLTSVGAGAIGMVVLLLLYPEVPSARLVGTDIAHAVPLALVAGLGHWYLGSIDGTLLVSLLVGSLPGIVIGSQLAAYVPDRVLRPILATALAAVGTRLIA